ncbi:ferredoxin--NADP reductase [Xanthocytophaga agilis]|uniref:Ferredoxin--NADP reductase n=1 Tax=Xanthocytophaga agilis TaxID=3048010 RepID=A0AAE3RCV7_9BACT|nr:ferredoxin--NADP reductase [Xanthocytophaga agilis]MDJ1506202.1 ferredoxin--NADP reductase [Xanthocytophaga agilis]
MSKYHFLKVEKIVRETPDSISVHFEQPANQRISYKSGQFLTLLVPVNGKTERRSYSMCSSPISENNLVVTVKRVEGGKVSNFLNDQLKPGALVEVMEPMGTFTIEPNADKQRHIILIGAGSGITPLMSIAKTILHTESRSRVSVLYGNRNEQSIIFKEELASLTQKFAGRLDVIHVLSQPASSWTGHIGRLNQSLVLKMLEHLPKWADTEYFICGPDGMMEEAKQALRILQIPSERVHSESFLTVTKEPVHGEVVEDTTGEVKDYTVTIMYEGAEYKVAVPAQKTILEAALDNDIDLPYSCQSGMCTACMGKCVSGKVLLDEEDGLSETEIKQGYILTCVGHPLTSDVVIEID